MTWLQSTTGLTPAVFALVALMTFGAAAVRGLTGFGMAIILVPLLGMVIRPDDAVILAILLQLLIGPVGLGSILRESHKSSALLIAAFAFASTPFGIWALAHTAPDVARALIALIAIGAFLTVILIRKHEAAPGKLGMIATGIAAGILTGFAAMPGPPVVPFYLRDAFEPRVARASMMLIFFVTAIAGTLASTLLGVSSIQLALTAILLFIPMALGNWLGGLAFGKIGASLWRPAVGVLLGVAAASALWRLLS